MEEESIRDNFVVIYELLDEVMDFGWPQVTETKILKEFIMQVGNKLERAQPSLPPQAVRCGLVAAPVSAGIRRYPPVSCHTHLAPVPAQLTNRVSWRPEGIKHRKNEIFLDVVERLNLLVSTSGSVLHSEIVGAIKMKSFLSGMPELKLGLNDKVLFQATGRRSKGKAVEMEDIKFHQCVRLARFENDRTISFIPPDGEFTLMTYRLNTHVRALRAAPLLPHSLGQGLSRRLVSQVKPLIWVESVVEPHKNSRIEYLVKAKSQFKSRSIANNVEIIIPVPPDVDSPAFKVRCPAWFYLSTWCVHSVAPTPGEHWYSNLRPRQGRDCVVHQAVLRLARVPDARAFRPAQCCIRGDVRGQGQLEEAHWCAVRDPILHSEWHPGAVLEDH